MKYKKKQKNIFKNVNEGSELYFYKSKKTQLSAEKDKLC